MIHSDQGSQFTSQEWRDFLKDHNLEASMSRRGNCYDNAVAESFFASLKTERIRRKIYKTREEARQDVFDYIELFYNPKRRHAKNSDAVTRRVRNGSKMKSSGVYILRGTSARMFHCIPI